MSAVPHKTLNSPHTAYLINPRGCLLQWRLSCAIFKLFVLFVSLKSVSLLVCVAQYNANLADRHVMSPEAYCKAAILSRSFCPCMFTRESHWLGITLLLLAYGWRGSSMPVWRHGIDLFQASTECQSYKCEEYDAVRIGTGGIYCLPGE